MGFSVSGSFAIILVASIVAFGMFHTATANTGERIDEANQDTSDRRLATQNTAITISNVTYDEQESGLWIRVNNTGATTLHVERTDLLVDGEYRTRPFDAERVGADDGTDLWHPGQQLVVGLDQDTDPGRVKVVTELGIAAVEVR